ncbi:hypothetical protein B1748_29165 [Paenibacillus sp. MY03]|uniref:hypothetical protein n=1 Tax=Paenibacillus sp. MY03 TaxID=302980 RepID=UPI000B3C2592|nr:hypothetical protein [Paenibacillus sp. MY03]OUS70307.1 hypothetical protein B1748_29165 [Paenibacillus sp. MY03]
MAKLEQVLKAELNPQTPVQDIMQVIDAMLRTNPGHEAAILRGVAEGVSIIASRIDQRTGEDARGGTEPTNRNESDK